MLVSGTSLQTGGSFTSNVTVKLAVADRAARIVAGDVHRDLRVLRHVIAPLAVLDVSGTVGLRRISEVAIREVAVDVRCTNRQADRCRIAQEDRGVVRHLADRRCIAFERHRELATTVSTARIVADNRYGDRSRLIGEEAPLAVGDVAGQDTLIVKVDLAMREVAVRIAGAHRQADCHGVAQEDRGVVRQLADRRIIHFDRDAEFRAARVARRLALDRDTERRVVVGVVEPAADINRARAAHHCALRTLAARDRGTRGSTAGRAACRYHPAHCR